MRRRVCNKTPDGWHAQAEGAGMSASQGPVHGGAALGHGTPGVSSRKACSRKREHGTRRVSPPLPRGGLGGLLNQSGPAIATTLSLTVLLTGSVLAQPYDLSWYTIDGGGAMRSESIDERYVLSGTIGQPDAGILTGGDYTLGGGFWGGGVAAAVEYKVYLPMILRQYP